MPEALVQSARVRLARAKIAALAERTMLENLASDYRRGRDPSANLKQLLEFQDLKRRLGI